MVRRMITQGHKDPFNGWMRLIIGFVVSVAVATQLVAAFGIAAGLITVVAWMSMLTIVVVSPLPFVEVATMPLFIGLGMASIPGAIFWGWIALTSRKKN